jgi:hypothetical protein
MNKGIAGNQGNGMTKEAVLYTKALIENVYAYDYEAAYYYERALTNLVSYTLAGEIGEAIVDRGLLANHPSLDSINEAIKERY